MPLLPFPDIPDVPGVPALTRNIVSPALDSPLSSSSDEVSDATLGPIVWGVFDDEGNQVLFPDSFVGIEYRNDSRVSDYPQEQGAFASYNKVETPYDCRVTMAIGTDQASRTEFIATLESLLKGLDLLTIITPEVTYESANLERYSYRRTATNGVSMITAELDFMEVRVTATAEEAPIDQPQNPAATDPVSDGQVQATPVAQSTVTAVNLPPLAATKGPAPTKSTGGATGSWDASNTPKPVSTGGASGSW